MPTATHNIFPAVLLLKNGTVILPTPAPPLLCTTGARVTVKFELLLPLATVKVKLPVVAPLGTWTTMPVLLQLTGVAATPLNVRVLVPCDAAKPVPAILTKVPTGPKLGVRPLMLGRMVKFNPLLARPPTVTTTVPVGVALPGTDAIICVSLQLVTTAITPLTVAVLDPWAGAKPVPVIVMEELTTPDTGATLVRLGVTPSVTVNKAPLLVKPLAATTILPVVPPFGIAKTICESLQLVGVTRVPFRLTVLAPCVAPKLLPEIVTDVPTGPADGVRPLMKGGRITVNGVPALLPEEVVTMTLPLRALVGTVTVMLVSDQLVTEAMGLPNPLGPLNVTVLDP